MLNFFNLKLHFTSLIFIFKKKKKQMNYKIFIGKKYSSIINIYKKKIVLRISLIKVKLNYEKCFISIKMLLSIFFLFFQKNY